MNIWNLKGLILYIYLLSVIFPDKETVTIWSKTLCKQIISNIKIYMFSNIKILVIFNHKNVLNIFKFSIVFN